MTFFFKDINKEINITEKDEKDYRNNNICRFFEKSFESDKVRDHCHSTVRYRVPAHSICNINVTQDQINFYHLYFTFLVIMIVIYFLKSYSIKRMIK